MKEIAEYLYRAEQRGEIRFLLIGGRSLEAHGYVRTTKDVDFLIAHTNIPTMNHLLETAGFQRLRENNICSRWQHKTLLHEDVDLMFVDPSTFEKLSADAVEWKLEHILLKVPSVQNLIALKIHAIHNNPDRRSKDGQDICTLLDLHPEALDAEAFSRICLKFGDPALLHYFQTLRSWSPTSK